MENIKSLVEMSSDYVETTGTNEFYYPDTSTTTEMRANQAEFNTGFSAQVISAG